MRTTPDLVRGAIKAPIGDDVDLAGFIRTGNALTNYIVTKDTSSILTTELLLELETYLACFFLALKHQQYATKNTGDASANFQTGQRGLGRFEANDWGSAAMALDVTGTLSMLNKGVTVVQFGWVGTPVTRQANWWDRD